jgi:hypothetical protein
LRVEGFKRRGETRWKEEEEARQEERSKGGTSWGIDEKWVE